MPSWALRLLAIAISGLTMLGSSSYVLAHPFNPQAPLQPPVVKDPEAAATPQPTPTPTSSPTPSPSPSPSPARAAAPTKSAVAVALPTATPAPAVRTPSPTPRTPAPTARPTLVLTSGVRMTAVPKVTLTHSS
jgi:hypothetical protein